MRVIVNADDYGLDENRTRAIQASFRMGAITQTTAMANMPWFERAMKEARELGFVDKVGLHFNLSEGAPLSDEARNCRVLCNPEGRFDKRWHHRLGTRLRLPKSARQAIAAEAKAQIERYLDCGGRLMHLDSHHHVHTDFSVATILLPIARRYGFKSVRRSRTLGVGPSALKRVYKFFLNRYLRSQLPFAVDHFGGFGDFVADRRRLPEAAAVEIMVHPLYGRWDAPDRNGPLVDSADLPMDEVLRVLK